MKTENLSTEKDSATTQSEQAASTVGNQDIKDSSSSLSDMQSQIKALQEEKERMSKFVETVKQEKRELKSQYADVDPEEFAQFRQFKEKAKDDKLSQLISQGRTDEARKMLAEDQANAFKQTESEFAERISKLQERAEAYESQLNEQMLINEQMRKTQYLDSLVRDDESFHKHHFDAFVRLNQHRLDIDDASGKYYALDESGKNRMIDAKGDLVTFEQFYLKEKSTPGGLFWKAGTGTGIVAANGSMVSKPYAAMNHEEKLAFKKSFKNEQAFMDELLRQRNSAKK